MNELKLFSPPHNSNEVGQICLPSSYPNLEENGKVQKYKKAVQRHLPSGPPKSGMLKKGCMKVGLPVMGVSSGGRESG